jgi:hypothetical protein
MVAEFLSLFVWFSSFSAVVPAAGTGTPSAPDTTAAADTTAVSPRIVRQFPPIEVSAPLHDMRSSETVRMIPGSALRTLPVDGMAEALALQPGVVAQGEELHVRGGRSGETTVFLDGIGLNEPQWHRAMGLPLLALRSADLVSGAPEAQYGCGLAGAVDLRSVDPGSRPEVAWRWQTALESRWYDRWSARVGTPLRILGLGLVAAGEATLDDSWLPSLRSESQAKVAGLSFDWRAENRMLGFFKLAPVDRPQRFSAEVLVSRHLQRPYDRAWSLDGWVNPPHEYIVQGLDGPEKRFAPPVFSPDYQPGYVAYSAADHVPITDERQVATLLSVSRLRPSGRATLSLGWLRTRTVTSLSGSRGTPVQESPPFFADNGFDVIWGDYPLYRESGSDAFTLRGDAERSYRSGSGIKAGAGLTYEDVSLWELEYQFGKDEIIDRVRAYHVYAPGGFAYVQGRWEALGMVMNTGLRAEYWTAGPQGHGQTLPWDGRGALTLSPRLGFAYPVSVHDAFSLAYQRSHQAPGRDYLYDQGGDILNQRNLVLNNRNPLGNPALRPATLISYEAALKHTFSLQWAAQVSVFYREVYEQLGARNLAPEGLPPQSVYVSDDDASAAGFEWSLIHAAGDRRRIEVHYTFMQAWGLESLPEGDPYGTLRGLRTIPLGETPLSWDRRHSFLLSGVWPLKRDMSLSWSATVGSPLPWTPKPRREQFTDVALVNSRRLGWTENTNLDVQWKPAFAHGLELGFAVRNLFDDRSEQAVTLDGFPNPLINTVYDDYGAYRAETGQSGGAYWVEPASGAPGYWVPVHDPRLFNPPRAVRVTLGASW